MRNISILGSGWLGTPLADHLIKDNYILKGSTTTLAKMHILEQHQIIPYHIDLREESLPFIDPFLANTDLLIITIPPIRNESTPTYANHFKKLISYIKKHEIKKLIMMSSISVYAPQKEEITEDNTQFSNEATAKQIREAENILLNLEGVHTTILRLGGLFSEDRRPVNYIVKKDYLENPNLPVNMAHLEDIIAFTTALIKQGFNSNTIYNIVSPLYKNRLDYYTREATKHHLTLPPLGEDNNSLFKKVVGHKIEETTLLNYRY